MRDFGSWTIYGPVFRQLPWLLVRQVYRTPILRSVASPKHDVSNRITGTKSYVKARTVSDIDTVSPCVARSVQHAVFGNACQYKKR